MVFTEMLGWHKRWEALAEDEPYNEDKKSRMAYATSHQPKINCCVSTASGTLLLTETGQEPCPRTVAEHCSLAPDRQSEDLAEAESLFNNIALLPGELQEIQGWMRDYTGEENWVWVLFQMEQTPCSAAQCSKGLAASIATEARIISTGWLRVTGPAPNLRKGKLDLA